MKKTYITTMPDHIGAFLKASECFAELGINIVRVSYNKAIDTHTLFIEARGDEESLRQADKRLAEIGYLQSPREGNSVVLLAFTLEDKPGSVANILRLIKRYELNISFMSSQENGTDYQTFKMGLYIQNEERLREFLGEAGEICPVRVVDYNRSEKVYDNTIFYQSFVSDLMECIGLPEADREGLLVNANLVMQMLDERGLSPYKTFESISRFAHLLAICRGHAFAPRVTRHAITEATEIILIEPPCGSNTAIVRSRDEVLFVDCGYALYREEMEELFRSLLPNYDEMRKRIYVTHADVDHCGLLPLFDEIVASVQTKECLALESEGADGYREQNALHLPYISICKTLTHYGTVDLAKVVAPWGTLDSQCEPLEQIGFFDVGELHFEVYQGKGG
ncbi:MAG: hypothetical protein Q4B54_09900, partial [Coriobacteriales bacterium]|nr:hypothetical protein [Coriobacteriales bacterium]